MGIFKGLLHGKRLDLKGDIKKALERKYWWEKIWDFKLKKELKNAILEKKNKKIKKRYSKKRKVKEIEKAWEEGRKKERKRKGFDFW